MVPSNSRSYLQGEQCLDLEGSLFFLFDAKEFRLVQICGLNAIVQVDDLEEVSNYYQNRGYFDELSMFVDSGLDLNVLTWVSSQSLELCMSGTTQRA
jgi:hypothetical protein